MLNEARVARPKSPDSNKLNMFWHHQPSKHRAGPRLAKHHHNVTHSTRFMPHARRHPTPPTLHVSSSYQPSTILKPAQVRRQHRNIPFSTWLMSHAQRRTRHCLTVQVLPPHRRRQPPSSADHHPHAPSICPCAAHSAWGVGVAEDIGVPPCPVHAD